MKVYFTTQDVAAMLNVTRVTVRNWIINGKLTACVTPGGHRRIEREDLVHFLRALGHSESIIESYEVAKQNKFIYCWEYQAKNFVNGSHLHNCESCLVYRSRSQRCDVISSQVGYCWVLCMEECSTCGYYNKYLIKRFHLKPSHE